MKDVVLFLTLVFMGITFSVGMARLDGQMLIGTGILAVAVAIISKEYE